MSIHADDLAAAEGRIAKQKIRFRMRYLNSSLSYVGEEHFAMYPELFSIAPEGFLESRNCMFLNWQIHSGMFDWPIVGRRVPKGKETVQ